jgi:hypothetical protein
VASTGGDWLRPDWFRSAMRAWTPPAMPAPVAAAMRQVVEQFGLAPATVAHKVIDAAASRLVGRETTLHAGATEVTLILQVLRLAEAPVNLMIGQVGDVEVEAEDVSTSALRISHLWMEARNVHVQPGKPAAVVAAPIKIRAVIAQAVLVDALAQRTQRVEIELLHGGTARAHLAGHRTLGYLDLVPSVEGRALVLTPSTIVVRGSDRLASLAPRLPRIRLPLLKLPPALHVTDVIAEDGQLVVDAVYEEWRTEVSPDDVEKLLKRIERYDGGILDIGQG